MTGYHVYYKNGEFEEFHQIDLLVNLASNLLWKEIYGPIKTYCNEKYYLKLREYNIHSTYDYVNTSHLEQIPYKEYIQKYWSFCKIWATQDIQEDKFVILDNDFFINHDIGLDWSNNFIGYHKEAFYENSTLSPYLNPKTFWETEIVDSWDWGTHPVNCAFIYLNSKHLTNQWFKLALDTISRNKEKPEFEGNADTIFIEQRLLPALTHNLGLKQDTILPNTYLTYIIFNDYLHEWEPRIDSSEHSEWLNRHVKHIWGLKTMYDNPRWRNLIIDIVKEDLFEHFGETYIRSNFKKLLDEVDEIRNLSPN